MSGPSPRVLVVQFQDDAPVGWLGEWLVEEGAVLDVRHLDRGETPPATLAEHDAVVVLGGFPAAYDDHPDVHTATALVRTAAAEEVPTLGICLGHQVCAVALGGRVHRNPLGRQLGVLPVGWSDEATEDPLLGPVSAAAGVVHWNGDVVEALPPGATVLARAPRGEVQAARLAPTVWGVQAHPEAHEAITAGWAAAEADRPGAQERAAMSAAVALRHDELARDWRPLARALVGLASGATDLPR
ncbi:glutamine amidotransferase [Marmoricola endophyticus]|uniref:Glutamine amidotransferase n=1 Tax=Marmoricola endophyticus TaxID=2040280 RepID=A0A917B945_9ACTN|nr:type 1 glutamine amidotransferase [Marmoricola endophyticus]GGF30787.1 glutamine amidotransferase [Marmoricola endophyticus]